MDLDPGMRDVLLFVSLLAARRRLQGPAREAAVLERVHAPLHNL